MLEKPQGFPGSLMGLCNRQYSEIKFNRLKKKKKKVSDILEMITHHGLVCVLHIASFLVSRPIKILIN